jgi:glyoxylase I family protein
VPNLDGTTHVNLTVSDLDRSTEWYCRVFGFTVVNETAVDDEGFRFRTLLHPQSLASVVLGDCEGADDERFDEWRIGLHHLGYHVPTREDLDAWAAHLDALEIEHSGVREAPHESGSQIWLRDPDNIWLELHWVNREFFIGRLRDRWRARSGRREGRWSERERAGTA